jgi:hypothetical protein
MLGIDDDRVHGDDEIRKVTVRAYGDGDDNEVARSSAIISCSSLVAEEDGFILEW